MFRRIAAFFRKVFKSKYFRILIRILIAYLILSFISSVVQLTRLGIPFRSAFNYVLRYTLGLGDFSLPAASIGLGIIFGLLWYRRNRKNTQDGEEEKTEEKPAEIPEEKQEEEIIETKHYMFH